MWILAGWGEGGISTLVARTIRPGQIEPFTASRAATFKQLEKNSDDAFHYVDFLSFRFYRL